MSSPPIPESITDAPPATKLLYRELAAADGSLPFGALVSRTEMARSTCRRNLHRLEDAGLVRRHGDDADGRTILFTLAERRG